MGYSHNWTHTKTFSRASFNQISDAIGRIIALAESKHEVAFAADEMEMSKARIAFNGAGQAGCETFELYQKRQPKGEFGESNWYFCKTNRAHYDIAVTACLAYLESIFPVHYRVNSDGSGHDWTAGIALAQEAIPESAPWIKAPLKVMMDDRFTNAIRFPGLNESSYEIAACQNGKAYIFSESDGFKLAPLAEIETYTQAVDWLAAIRDDIYCGSSTPVTRYGIKTRQNKAIASARAGLAKPDMKAFPCMAQAIAGQPGLFELQFLSE
jgi:hypothetical protein